MNLPLGLAGGTLAGLSAVAQSERNPYCPEYGWLGTTLVAAGLLVAAAVVNVFVVRGSADPTPTGTVRP